MFLKLIERKQNEKIYDEASMFVRLEGANRLERERDCVRERMVGGFHRETQVTEGVRLTERRISFINDSP